MWPLNFVILGLIVGAISAQAQVIECTSAPMNLQPVGNMLKFEDNLFQSQCGYTKNNECRYSEASCERSIGCADIVMSRSPNSPEAQMGRLLLIDEIREYATIAVDTNLKKIQELEWVKEFAGKNAQSVPQICSPDYLTVHDNIPDCDAEVLKDLPVIGEPDSVRYNFSIENKEKNKLALNVDSCRLGLALGSIFYAKDSSKITQNDTDKLVTKLKKHDTECLKKLYSIITGKKSDEKTILQDLATKGGSLDSLMKYKVREYLTMNCKVVPSMDNICENATKMNLGRRSEIKNLFLPEYTRDTGAGFDSNERYQNSVNKINAVVDKGIYFRLLEASRCKGMRNNYKDGGTCNDVLQVLKNESVIPKAQISVSELNNEQQKEAELLKKLANKNVANSGSIDPYGSAEAFVGPMPRASSTTETVTIPDKKSMAIKSLDEIPATPAEKVPTDEAKSTTQSAAPVQNSNSANYNNAYAGVDYNIPSTHPMVTDQSGVPIPPQNYPSYNGAQTPPQQTQAGIVAPNTQAIQAKLEETQAKLDKLTAEVAATKAEAEKKKQQDEIETLKKEIEKLKTEKASAVLASTQPITPVASPSPPINSPVMATAAPTRQEEYRSAPAAVQVQKGNTATKVAAVTPGSGSAQTSSGALQLRQDIIDMPSVDLTNTSSEDPTILKLAMNSVGAKAFPVQDKNKIIWTIVPLVKDGKVISYTAIREKKPEVGRVPASVNIAPVDSAKREIFLKDLNGLMKSKN